MTSIAPTRFRVVLTQNPDTQALVERREYWPETQWMPTSALGVYVHGDQTVLAADGSVTFLDCHVLPSSTTVYPFGEWAAAQVDPVITTALTVEVHTREGSHVETVGLRLEGNVYCCSVPPGTVRVTSVPV